MSRRPVVILTALDLEYQAIRDKLVDLRLRRHRQGTRFEVGRLSGGRCRLALAHVGKGNQAAAVLAERAIAEFDPLALVFVGVAGALHSHIKLGDVVVATHVYAVHGGTSEDDGFKSRPRSWEISHGADQLARHVDRNGSWRAGLSVSRLPPKVHFGPIAAGEVVLNSKDSEHARRIRKHYNDALAVEMEGAGVAQAGHLNGRLPVVVVRGISDRADGTKETTDRDQWQERAMANAAAFAVALAEDLSADDEHGGQSTATETRGNSAMTEQTRNVAKDNARVMVQAGTVYGGIRLGEGQNPPADLAEALAGLRAALRRARTTGDLDDDTYEAVETELTVADTALRANTPESRGRLVLALKKVRGLIGDVAELAAQVAIIIALVQSLS